MIDAHYDTDEGEFVDFKTLDDWRAMIEAERREAALDLLAAHGQAGKALGKVVALEAENASSRAQINRARDDALEEAARVAQGVLDALNSEAVKYPYPTREHDIWMDRCYGAKLVTSRIRALRTGDA